MTTPPLVLSLTFAALIGWPAIKIIMTMIARPTWRAQRALHAALVADPTYDRDDHVLLDKALDDGRGSPVQLVLPAVAFFGGIAVLFEPRNVEFVGMSAAERSAKLADLEARLALAESGRQTAGAEALVRDKRFRAMTDNAFALAALRYPICSFLTGVAAIPAIIGFGIISGFKVSVRRLVSSLASSSREAVRAFEHTLNVFARPC